MFEACLSFVKLFLMTTKTKKDSSLIDALLPVLFLMAKKKLDKSEKKSEE